MKILLKHVLVPMFMFGIICCGNTNARNEMKTWDGKVIVETGTYYIERNEYVISVSKDDKLMLHYSVLNEHGDKIIKSVEHASVVHRWCVFWDEENTLWVWSSDIGGFFWEKNKTGKYEQNEVKSTEHFNKMPIEVFSFLPSSLRKKLNEEGVVREGTGVGP